MKPYTKKKLTDKKIVFNERLSRKRRTTKYVFGMWINRFRIFAKRANLTPDKASVVAMAAPAKYNLLRFKASFC